MEIELRLSGGDTEYYIGGISNGGKQKNNCYKINAIRQQSFTINIYGYAYGAFYRRIFISTEGYFQETIHNEGEEI